MHYDFICNWRGIVIEVFMDILNAVLIVLRGFTSYCDVSSGKEYILLSSIRRQMLAEHCFSWSAIGCLPFLSVFVPMLNTFNGDWPGPGVTNVGASPFFDLVLILCKIGRCWSLTTLSPAFMSLEYSLWYGMSRLITCLIIFGHLAACFWHLSVYYCNDLARIVRIHIPNEEDRTLFSWYFIALRDGLYMVSAQDRQHIAKDGEFVTLCIIGPFAAFFFAYVFGNTTVLITRSLALQTQHCSHMAFIRSAMDSLGLPKE